MNEKGSVKTENGVVIDGRRRILTHYNGYNFRSRTEARYAVLFDALGVDFRYELDGFELQGGMCYLPDFWLAENVWVEVKGGWPTADELEKAKGMVVERGTIVFASGDPMTRTGYVFGRDNPDAELKEVDFCGFVILGDELGFRTSDNRSFVFSPSVKADPTANVEMAEYYIRGTKYDRNSKYYPTPEKARLEAHGVSTG